jgi:hypothetical protein
MVALIQTTIATVLGPLVAELAASRETNQRQADTIGQLRADLATAQAENRALTARTGLHSPDLTSGPPWVRWRAGTPLWLLTLLAIAAVVVLLVWPW